MPLDLHSFPMRLFRATQERAWIPSAVDLSREQDHWLSLSEDEKDFLLRLVSGFRIGERGVTHELGPLQTVLRQERRLDEEMYVTAQLFEEARHVEFFERWLDEALPGVFGRDIPFPDLRGDLFSARLPEVMRALYTDPSPRAQLHAVITYHLYVEGVGAEASYPVYFRLFEKTGLFPGLKEGITLIRRDEARHIAFGTFVLQRLLNENPELEEVFDEAVESLRDDAEAAGGQTFAPYEGKPTPFGLDPEEFRHLYLQNLDLQKRNVFERRLPTVV